MLVHLFQWVSYLQRKIFTCISSLHPSPLLPFPLSLIHSSISQLFSTCHVPGMVLGTGATEMVKPWSVFLKIYSLEEGGKRSRWSSKMRETSSSWGRGIGRCEAGRLVSTCVTEDISAVFWSMISPKEEEEGHTRQRKSCIGIGL